MMLSVNYARVSGANCRKKKRRKKDGMTRKIDIFDTTLRDGEQSPGASMNTEEKLVIARQLLRLNVDVIEAGFPISSPGDFESVRRISELAGVRNGATQIECTINGLGERAGNTAMEEVVMAMRMHGEELDAHTDINTREFIKASRLVSSITGMNVQANKAIVGANAFAHSSGIHQDGVLKKRDTYEIIDPAEVGVGQSQIVLTARSGHAALKHRLEELGYEYEGEELDRLYTAFLDVADKKKEVYDEDLEALVNERDREECAIYTLEGVQVSCGFPLKPTATVTLRGPEGDVRTVCDWGAGPIDAVYKAIDQIVQVDNDLSEFAVNAVTRGIDALGEVTVRVKAAGGEVYVGRGADGDIIVSSAKAYLNALNRLLAEKR